MKKAYMFVQLIDINKGGMTTAMLNRASEFSKSSIESTIVTFNYNVDYREVEKSLISSGKMCPETKHLNIFDYYINNSIIQGNNSEFLYSSMEKKIAKCIQVTNDNTSSRYFDSHNGEYLGFARTIKDEIIHIDVMENNCRKKRIIYRGKKLKTLEMFDNSNKLIGRVIFNNKEQPILNIKINVKTGGMQNIFFLERAIQFPTFLDFCNYFIEEVIADDENNLLICDGPGSFPKMLHPRFKKSKKYAFIHTNHFKYPYNFGSEVKVPENFILKSADKIDGVIVMTTQQLLDIKKQYNIDNVYLIPNFLEMSNIKLEPKVRQNIVIISRIVQDKGFDFITELSAKLLESNISTEIHIYGSGPYEKELKEIISKNNLRNIKFFGYSNEIAKIYQSAYLSLSLSKFEGYGLSIAESLYNKTPVISFDILYGPGEMLKNGKNGYLTEYGNIEEMVNKIYTIINNKNIEEVEVYSRESIKKLHDKNSILDKWKNLW